MEGRQSGVSVPDPADGPSACFIYSTASCSSGQVGRLAGLGYITLSSGSLGDPSALPEAKQQ